MIQPYYKQYPPTKVTKRLRKLDLNNELFRTILKPFFFFEVFIKNV